MRNIFLILLTTLSLTSQAQSGISWSPTEQVASSAFDNMHPRITIDGSGNPLILWGKGDVNKVYFTRRENNSFAPPLTLNPDAIPVFAASWAGPDLAAHGDTVYAVFKHTPEHLNSIYLVTSTDGGATFSTPVQVDSIADNLSRFPSVGTDAAGNPLIAFMKFDPNWGNARYVLTRSADLGQTFEPDILGSAWSGGDVCDCCPSTVVTSGNTVALMYRDNLNNLRNNWTGISLDNGASFAGGIEIDNTDWMINACPSSGPDGIIVGDKLHSVFMSSASGKTLCYRSSSTISTLQMDSISPLTANFQGLGLQNFPRIASWGNSAAIVWAQSVNGSSQLALQFTNNLSNGFPDTYETVIGNGVVNADVALYGDKIYVVWEDNSATLKFKSGTFMLSGTSGPETAQQAMRIFPNPATGNLLRCVFEDKNDIMTAYEVVNVQGQVIDSGLAQTPEGILQAELTTNFTGVCFVRAWRNSTVHLSRVVIP
ncbi:MAG TPA: hypothetical protein VK168_06535 [Saprospiraceae bacterium]|nr:hypothetical protein [Saprospiraceae bacterium]